jgi:hypothetical protein
LDGIIFKWIIQDKQSGNIRFMKFRDSSYALDPVLEEIEAKGQQGSKVLLEGKLTIHFTQYIQGYPKSCGAGALG